MSSWMECGCGGDVILYENPNQEYMGRVWPILLTGNCRLCGRYHVDVPGDLKKDLAQARIDYERAEIRKVVEEEERAEEERRQWLKTLAPEELLKEVGPDHYPWVYYRIHDKPGKGGLVVAALTIERARIGATAIAQKGQIITIEQDYQPIEEWVHGERPELQKYIVAAEWDYTINRTGELVETSNRVNCGCLEDAKRIALKNRELWIKNKGNTYYRYTITTEDGNLVEAFA